MAAGLPVVGTSVGGIPELVDHGKTGLLIEPGNPVRFAEALVSLLKDEPRRTAMGRMARETALQRHSIEAMVRATERVFLEAASEALSRGKLRSARIGH
jgi:glycosyltransferase involved in cell wall biosynthesis